MRFLNTPVTDLTYNDVFLVPSSSRITSRFDVDLQTGDPTGSTTPLVAANMTAVTGKRMVETMARRGGLGVLPQDIPADVVARETAWVKSRSPHYESVRSMRPTDTVHDALAKMRRHAHASVVVTDADGVFQGLVLDSDCREVDRFTQLHVVMRPEVPVFTTEELHFAPASGPASDSAAQAAVSRDDQAYSPAGQAQSAGQAQLAELRHAMAQASMRMERARVHVAPVVDGERVVGVISRQGAVRSTIYVPNLDAHGALKVGAAVGINGDVAGKTQQLIDAGVDVLVVDTAHGHQRKMFEALSTVREVAPHHPIVAGNVVTADGVRDLVDAGADVIKVGVGPGAMCTTRMMTAVGRPQFSAVLECAAAAAELGAHVWADGGVKYPRDVALALAAGASQVMIGSWFAGTWEGPGELNQDANGRYYKESFGMASTRAVLNRTQGQEAFERARKAIFEEGISSSKMYLDPRRPGVEDLIDHITAGVRSSMTYAGATNTRQFADRAVVGVQNSSGYEEGRARGESWA
ncbi:GuaB1 family IMP dehydrogenase-related protein [Kocuria sp.]|uniref:GMP reductase n=1 Tax=Kocuria sp. TaxID=1871328 RepID=UPI0026E0AE62|nr:GuaB1 family IMP dehydrogenase-related protein [Kocuria sp.]MDO5619699.1 GuaB1 family IMP dehydrogenase-related protein [Kocuria sp.]